MNQHPETHGQNRPRGERIRPLRTLRTLWLGTLLSLPTLWLPATANAAATPGPTAAIVAPRVAPNAKPRTKLAKTTKAPAKGAKKGSAAPTTAPAPAEAPEVAPTEPPASSSPMAELKKSNDQLQKLLKKKYPEWSPEAEAQKADVKKLVGGFLDYRELARRALARHWDTVTPEERREFVDTLHELVERSYLRQVRGEANYSLKYSKEQKNGSEATVDATLATTSRGKKVTIAMNYKLIYKDHWFVYDVVTDDQSMLENYRAEFNKIISKDGFDALLKRMKKKLEAKDE